ncbi:MAG: hypothetical protein Q4F57_02460 [Weeksellaceae bacterium]|nr:hypothetical protein [Weeksellaceae bacterium]
MKTKFKVTQLLDPVKSGGSLQVGRIYTGTAHPTRPDVVYFTDTNGCEWTFWAGITCQIIKPKKAKL